MRGWVGLFLSSALSLSLMHLNKIADRAVVSLLELGIEETCGQLTIFPVIVQALAAFMFSLTGLIRAIAHLLIAFDNAIHRLPPGWNILYFNRKGPDLALV
jgi:hypothetical protein